MTAKKKITKIALAKLKKKIPEFSKQSINSNRKRDRAVVKKHRLKGRLNHA